MNTNKTITIIATVGMIMFFGTLWIITISNAYINSPSEFTLRFEIENNTQEVITGLNGSIVINNYYGNFTKEITLCKDSLEQTILKENGEVLKTEMFENVYNCTIN